MKKVFKISFFVALALVILFSSFIVASAIALENSQTESVAIIGGADGPTAILISRTLVFDNPSFRFLIASASLLVISAIGWIVTKKSKA